MLDFLVYEQALKKPLWSTWNGQSLFGKLRKLSETELS